MSENKLLDVPGLQSLRKELLESALDYYQQFLDDHANDPDLVGDVALTWYRVGRIETEIDKNTKAQADFEKALAFRKSLPSDPPGATGMPPWPTRFNALGNLASADEPTPDARRWFQRARDLRKQLADAAPSDPQLRRKLANADNNLAAVDAGWENWRRRNRSFRRPIASRKAGRGAIRQARSRPVPP